jgi:site-specific DNA recombinase
MQRSIIYCRVSSERQKHEGHGLESQEHRCREFASRNAYEVERVFCDSFSGGGDYTKRPAMSEMLKYMDSKPFNSYVVIFDDLKRLARDTEQYIKLKKAFLLRGATVQCLNFTFDDTPEGVYFETVMAAHAQLEREHNRRQVLQKMKARLELGYWCFPDVPVGYKYKSDPVHGKLPVLIPKSSKLLKEALEGFASGKFMEQEDVRKFLERNNINDGRPVYLQYVKRLLTKVFYAGYIEYEPWEVSRRQARHEALIDLAIYNRIQERLNSKTTTHIKKVLNDDFPIRGFVLCSCCRKPMTASWSTGRNGKKHPYYRCKTKVCSERNRSINKETIEKEFEAILANIKPSCHVLNLTKAILSDVWTKKEAELAEKRKVINSELIKIESERVRFLQLIPRATSETVVVAYENQIDELLKKELVLKGSLMSFDKHKPNIETALDILFDFLKNPLKQWQNGNIYTKKLVLSLVFEQNLAYNRKSGFETAFLSLPLRVFTLPEGQKSSLVEMPGIEPGCKRRS